MASTPCNRPRRYGSTGYMPTFRRTVPNGIKSSPILLISNLFANYYPPAASINHRDASFVTLYDMRRRGGGGRARGRTRRTDIFDFIVDEHRCRIRLGILLYRFLIPCRRENTPTPLSKRTFVTSRMEGRRRCSSIVDKFHANKKFDINPNLCIKNDCVFLINETSFLKRVDVSTVSRF